MASAPAFQAGNAGSIPVVRFVDNWKLNIVSMKQMCRVIKLVLDAKTFAKSIR